MGSRQREGRERREGAPDLATRERLLNAAGQLMTESGAFDFTLSDVANKSGLNSALVKYYFGSKSGMMLALLRHALGPAMSDLRLISGLKKSPQDKLRVHVSGLVSSHFRHPYANRLMHQLLADDAETFGPIISEEFLKPVAEVQRKILEEGLEAGVFRKVDPLLFHFHIMGACDQIFLNQKAIRHIFSVDMEDQTLKRNYTNHVCSSIIEGILTN